MKPAHAAAAKMIAGEIAGHVMTERPAVSYHFRTPSKGSIYAYSLTWTPGSLFLAGDIGEMTITHYHAMPTLEAAFQWAATSHYDYLLGKSNRRPSFDRAQTIAHLVDTWSDPDFRHEHLKPWVDVGKAWGAGLRKTIERQVRNWFEDLSDEEVARAIYEAGQFDDWFGSTDWTAHDIHQITAIMHGVRLIRDRLQADARSAA